MILIITAQDLPTQDNLAVARALIFRSTLPLLEAQAVRRNVELALRHQPTMPMFAFCHGQRDCLIGNDGIACVELTDIAVLNIRTTFAFACHTAESLGEAVSKAGGTWFGYAGPVNCLPSDHEVREQFIRIIFFIFERFPGCHDRKSAESFIQDLENLTNAAHDAFDEICATLEQYAAVRDIIYRLRVWIQGEALPVMHRDAFGPLL